MRTREVYIMKDLLVDLFKKRGEYILDIDTIQDDRDKLGDLEEFVREIMHVLGIDSYQDLKAFFDKLDEERFFRLISDLVEETADPDAISKVGESVLALGNSLDLVKSLIDVEEVESGDHLENGTPEVDDPANPEGETEVAEEDSVPGQGSEGPESGGQSPEGSTEEDVEAKVRIVDPKKKVSTRPWSSVNKIALRNKVMKLLEDGQAGAKEALYEIYGLVRCEDKMTCWKFPHHELIKNDVVLNINGLRAAAVALLGARSQPKVTREEKKSIAKHLVRHYDQIEINPPIRLKRLAAGEEVSSLVNLSVNDEVFAEVEKAGGDPDALVGLLALGMEVVDVLIEEGIIEVDGNLEIEIKDLQQLNSFLMNVDRFANNVVAILTGNVDDVKDLEGIDKEAVEKLEAKVKELVQVKDDLQAALAQKEELEKDLDEALQMVEEKEKELAALKEEMNLLRAKFDILAEEYVELSGSSHFVNTLVEAEDEKEIKVIARLRKDFGGAKGSIRKNSVFKNLGMLENLEDGSVSERNDNEPAPKIDKKVQLITSFI